jgi:hypothetical protein
MAGKQAPQYKRSWKNLLLNKRYQLRFTLFMVGVSAILMSVLGLWVMKEANEATTVAMIRVRGEACPKIPQVIEVPSMGMEPAAPMNLDAPMNADAPPPAAGSAAAGSAATPEDAAKPDPARPELAPIASSDPAKVAEHNAQEDILAVRALLCTDAECKPEAAMPLTIKANKCDDYVKAKFEDADAVDALRKAQIPVVKCEGGESHSVADADPPRRATVQLEESSMTITPTLPTDFADRMVSHHLCELRQASKLDRLNDGRMRILYVLIGTGLLLMVGLGIYGIKMTHKVAGPLFKVTLYLAKMRDGRYDKVWNLRKGDQLMDFYEHFKSAHAGVVTMEKSDIEHMKAAIEAAEAAGLSDHESVTELKALVKKKENALE